MNGPVTGEGRHGTTTMADQRTTADTVGTASLGEVRPALKKALKTQTGLSVKDLGDLQLYYVRGVSEFENWGEKFRTVIFVPEFLYVADIGKTHLAGFRILYRLPDYGGRVTVLGDPDFPRLNEVDVVSIEKPTPQNLIYPFVAGEVLVSFDAGTTLAEARKRLKGYLTQVKSVAPSIGLFKGTGGAFEEMDLIACIEKEVKGVRYAEPNGTVRRGEFGPGWMVDRVL